VLGLEQFDELVLRQNRIQSFQSVVPVQQT
jgi:hypothetical protein